MIKVMCNASPIITLSIIGQLDLLWQMFEVYVPSAVYQEVVFNQFDQDFGKDELGHALSEGHIKLYNVQDQDFVEKLYGHFTGGN
jgi:predicted nucleic acid-binding protein